MNKGELVAAIAEKTGLKRDDAKKAVDAFSEVVLDALKANDKVQLIGFGTFEVSERAEREGFNPRNREEKIVIPASRTPKFKAGKAFKDALNA